MDTEQKEKTMIDLVEERLKEESKIKTMNNVLIDLKNNEKKLEHFSIRIEKEWNFIYHLGISVLIAIIYLTVVMVLSNSLQEDYTWLHIIYELCKKILPTFLFVNALQLLAIWLFQLCKKPINQNLFLIRNEILDLSKEIILEIQKRNELILRQSTLENSTTEVSKYHINSFLNKLSSSPEYEMEQIIKTLEPKLELPRKISSEISDSIK